MTEEDKKFIEDNRFHYDTLTKAFYMRGLSGEVRNNMQRIIGQYFRPGYQSDLWCPTCVSDMVTLLYTLYDNWLSEQKEIVYEES
jgi:hypothetical protein